jgi:hypothetical protein
MDELSSLARTIQPALCQPLPSLASLVYRRDWKSYNGPNDCSIEP